MKIYTRTGDDGSTGLYGGGRVAKCDVRIAAFGSVDELNSALGLIAALELEQDLRLQIEQIQNRLFELGAELASPDPEGSHTATLSPDDVGAIETLIDQLDETLPELTTFILPGGSPVAASMHFARSVCRRAEREVVALAQQSPVRDLVIRYLNRVGDLLFVMARVANRRHGVGDIPWEKKA